MIKPEQMSQSITSQPKRNRVMIEAGIILSGQCFISMNELTNAKVTHDLQQQAIDEVKEEVWDAIYEGPRIFAQNIRRSLAEFPQHTAEILAMLDHLIDKLGYPTAQQSVTPIKSGHTNP